MKKGYVLGLLAVFVVFASLGSQCQKITDPAGSGMTGYSNPAYAPPFSPSDFDSEETCQSACNGYYTGLLEEENLRHEEVMDGLEGGDPETKLLRKEEIELHKTNVREIQDARYQCVKGCHDQGGMSGGF
jgi:hypothetical protein